MQKTAPKYVFDVSGNSYFNGSDGLITRLSDGKDIRLNMRDGVMAVNVKDYTMQSAFDSPKLAELIEASGNPDWFYDYLYERGKEIWWQDAAELATEAGYSGVYSSGRSGGWCCIDGTQHLVDNFPSGYDYPGPALEESGEDIENYNEIIAEWREAIADRDRFIDLAFDLRYDCTGSAVDIMQVIIDDEHIELEAKRRECIILGED